MAVLAFRIVFLLCFLATIPSFTSSASTPIDGLNFLALGDWGGQDASPYYTIGQMDSSIGMGQIGAELNSQFVLALGDNFYEEGIHTNCDDPRFPETFEDVYTASSLQTPWYVLAGNHDYYGNVSAEIAYSAISPRWNFPDYNYTFTKSFTSNGQTYTVQVIMIDTVILAGNSDKVATPERPHPPAPGPESVEDAAAEWAWIEAQIAASTADYLWVAGHYPVWSVCEHGPTFELVDQLKPMLQKYNVTGYICGHDHCLEYLDEGLGPVYVLSGAGKECCYADSNIGNVPKGSLKFLVSGTGHGGGPIESGFTSFRHTAEGATVVYHASNGTALFTTPVLPPRKIAN